MKFKLLILALFIGYSVNAQVRVQLGKISFDLPKEAIKYTDSTKIDATDPSKALKEVSLLQRNKYSYKIGDIIYRFFPAKYQGDGEYIKNAQKLTKKWGASKENEKDNHYASEIIELEGNKVLRTSSIRDNQLYTRFLFVNAVKKISFSLETTSNTAEKEKINRIVKELLKSVEAS